MSAHATGTFEIETWEETPYDEHDGTKLTRTRLTKTFHGDIQGSSTAELLMAYGTVEGSAAHAGFERVVGRVHGRSGSFVLHHTASSDASHGPPTACRRPRGAWSRTLGRASSRACAAKPLSPSIRMEDTSSRSTTTSSNIPTENERGLVGLVR